MRQKLFGYSPKELLLSVQHLFAMFGATVLVPIITGLDPATALVTAGIGTLIFHLLTKKKVPVFLGSSFAFMPAIIAIVSNEGVRYAQGGIIVAGLVYVILSIAIYFVVKNFGADAIRKILPPIVVGPIIILIGLSLASVGVADANGQNLFGSPTGIQAFGSWMVALFTISVVIACMVFLKGVYKLIPILIGLGAGYGLCIILYLCGWKDILNFAPIVDAAWLNLPYGGLWDASDKTNGILGGIFTLPAFSWTAIVAIAPIALVTFMEHVGDITTNSTVCGKDFVKDPGLHRTLLGDGVATAIAGFLGGPSNTTYSENTGVLATTKNYDPKILRLTAVWAIVLGFFGKFGGFLQTIPAPVRGGVEIILFGMIAAIGIRTMLEAKIDFTKSKNLIIVALILVLGIGLSITGGIVVGNVTISGLFVATVVGVAANLIFRLARNEEEQSNDSPAEEDLAQEAQPTQEPAEQA